MQKGILSVIFTFKLCKIVMARKTKIGTSEWKDYVESELLKGATYRDLASDLKSKGFIVSHTAIAAYHDSEMGKRRKGNIPEQRQVNEYVKEIPFNESADTVSTILRSYQRQAQIFEHKQSLFMAGQEKFPSRELDALKKLQEIIKAHSANVPDFNTQVVAFNHGYESLEIAVNESMKVSKNEMDKICIDSIRKHSPAPLSELTLRAVYDCICAENVWENGANCNAPRMNADIREALGMQFGKIVAGTIAGKVDRELQTKTIQKAIKEGGYKPSIKKILNAVWRHDKEDTAFVCGVIHEVCNPLQEYYADNPKEYAERAKTAPVELVKELRGKATEELDYLHKWQYFRAGIDVEHIAKLGL